MSQRNRLFVLLLAVTIPMFTLAAIFVLTSVREARHRADRDALSIAAAAALATESFFEGHIHTLSAIGLTVRDAPGVTEAELRARLADVYRVNPEWDGLSVADEHGTVIAGSRETSAGVDLSEREYLQRLFATGEPVVSAGLVTLVELIPSVIVSVPVSFTDGTRGALVGSVTLQHLSRTLIEDLAQPGVRIGLMDHLGQTLVHPDPERVNNLVPVGDRPDVAAALRGESGTLEAEREGVPTLVAYAPVPALQWAVTVSEPTSSAYLAANHVAERGALLVSMAALAVLVGGWYLGGRLNRSYVAIQEAREAEAQARERAETALRSRDEFISVASHELRNPVAAVSGFAQLMQRRLDRGDLSEDQLREYVQSIAASGAYLGRLVEDLLNVSRLEGGRIDLRFEEVDLRAVVRRAIGETPLAERSIEVEQPEEPVRVMVDPDRVTQVLVNLLENAAKYSPAGSTIRVATTSGGGEVRVAVRDAGIGLPAHELDRLFSPFGRASNAREANIPGLGLGLYVSRRLAEAHGGTLLAESGGEDCGSTFTLTLPAGSNPPSHPPDGSPRAETAASPVPVGEKAQP